MNGDELLKLADDVFWMDRELPEMVFRGSDLSFFVTEGLCPLMEPVSVVISEVVRALEPPERQEVYWVNREGGSGVLRCAGPSTDGTVAHETPGSMYPDWRKVLDAHSGFIYKFVMFSPGKNWGLWVDVNREMAVLALPAALDVRLRERVEQEFEPSVPVFVEDRMRPIWSSHAPWQAFLDRFVDQYAI